MPISFFGRPNCGVYTQYADSSYIYAWGWKDTVKFGTYSATTNFGNIYNLSSSFITPVNPSDGILGLARYIDGYVGYIPSVLDALVGSGMPNMFALCLTKSGGLLQMGGYNQSFSNNIAWIPYDASAVQYQISVSFLVSNVSVPNSSINMLVDSGSTVSFIPQNLFNSLVIEIQDQCTNSACLSSSPIWNGKYVSINNTSVFPNITIVTKTNTSENVNLTLTPQYYLIQYQNLFAFGFAVSNNYILGDPFLRAFFIVFDRQSNLLGIGKIIENLCLEELSATPPGLEILPPVIDPPIYIPQPSPQSSPPPQPSQSSPPPNLLYNPNSAAYKLSSITIVTLLTFFLIF